MRSTGKLVLVALLALAVASPASAGWFDWIFNNPLSSAPCGGFTFISATPIYVTSTQNLSGQRTTLYVAANCGGESASLIQRDALSSALGLPIGTDIQLSIASVAEEALYPIRNDAIPVIQYAPSYAQCEAFDSSGCSRWNNYQNSAWYHWLSACGTVAQLGGEQIGTLGSLGPPTSTASAILTVTVGNATAQVKIGSADLAAKLLTPDGDEIGSVQWLGSLVSGQSLPSESNYGAFYDSAAKAWKLVSSSEREDYRNRQVAAETALLTIPTAGYCWGTLWNPAGAINAASLAAASAAQLRASTAQLGATPIHNADSLTDAAAPFTVVGRINNPTLLISIRADLLSISMPVGTPRIDSVTLPSFGGGESAQLAVGVTNTGTAQGSFVLSVPSCGSATVAPAQAATVQPGKSATLYTQLTASTPQSAPCQVRVCDLNGLECAEAATTLSVSAVKQCIPGEIGEGIMQGGQIFSTYGITFGGGSTATELLIVQCNPDGMGYTPVLRCDAGVPVYQPSLKPYPWACSSVAQCGAPSQVLSNYLLDNRTAFPQDWIFKESNGCSYLCRSEFGAGTMKAPTGVSSYLLGCGDVSKTVASLAAGAPPPPPPPPPAVKNQSGAGTSGQCRADTDCRYVGDKCVTGACQPSATPLPGFEAVFAVAGLLVVAWLVKRRQGGP